ncbi:FAD-dependent oxidoreductase [Amycolatopsis sp. K13G38]|uniref:FAD-dependent oxidoreductase n=1 Tax=Amycolatopsis acididurans TaxID=2724524 RepID=A0ABX1JEP5_9PSEU|nr:FAD-dependent oxidoreductase [Amycolatopsis acididurans]NKQ57701.1 FAD-dependent oxidoreductase [Amycolatopsis acididurans]
MDFPHLFTPLRVGRAELPSRLYVPAHQEMFAENGLPSARQADYYRLRARAGAAMQITGNTAVTLSQREEMGPARLANVDETIVPGYRMLARAVHDEGGRLLAQLSHSGLLTRSANMHVLAASEYRPERTRETASPISADAIAEVVEAYRLAADRAVRGDLDGVELLMARGSLLATFLSPEFNRRDDEWGGAIENRMRFPLAVLASVRAALGPEPLLGVRISADEYIAGGMTAEHACEVVRHLEKSGMVDYISVTGGTPTHRVSFTYGYPATPTPHAIFRHLAAAVKQATTLPVACVGRVTDPALAEEIVASGDADLVGVVRAQIADPGFFSKARRGRAAEIRPCVGANVCANFHLTGAGVRCIGNPHVGREDIELLPPSRTKRYVVVGAGPAGLEAARSLATQGHSVTVFERDDAVGGQLRRWTGSTSRREFRRLLDWWRRELDRLDVRVELGISADLERIRAERADHVIVATGSVPLASPLHRPDFGIEAVPVFEALAGPVSGQVVVVDQMGRADAALVAEHLAERGAEVTVVTSCLHLAEGEGDPTLYPLLLRMNELGVRVLERARVTAEADGLRVTDVFGDRHRETLSTTTVVHWLGASPCGELAAELAAAGISFSTIGDAIQPRRVHDAVAEAAACAHALDSIRTPTNEEQYVQQA